MAYFTEVGILLSIFLLLAFMAFMSAYTPPGFTFFSTFDFGFITTSIIGVTAACVIITGLGCTIAMGVFGFANLLLYFVLNQAFVKGLIITPIVAIIVYIIAKLGRGGG